jgi:hypothetical protein
LRLAVAERHNYWRNTGRYDERRGNVTVFELVDGSWLQLGNAIVGEPDEALGLSLSFSDDGAVLAVGCDDVHNVNVSSSSYWDGSSPEGFVRVFKYDSGTWTQLGDKIVATGRTWDETETNLDDCSISGDGRSIVVSLDRPQTPLKCSERARPTRILGARSGNSRVNPSMKTTLGELLR